MEIRLFNNNAQPLYVITDWEGKTLVEPKGYDKDATSFIAFLDEAKRNFDSKINN
ncbi:MAG: hypothetical protein H7329_09345 [Opitutaceae bacterium]|nr:hypothetical protein [Cytophagales bacterium]